ncbi:HAD-IA family hydrolase [Mesorhizobium australafricanum]|uniref:HAD-IA family hydrolase n=1 Tax=Mesorhizobium australafricanum TaxID=3072311 RepID=A0ABU4X426_9HYPH|nr:HAD-IA family hydrolase [Mesorhizobium sp. VK3E]MDX8443069.1 HAD-IA family hydrolase [Mesorhizobium sp. VK3E]
MTAQVTDTAMVEYFAEAFHTTERAAFPISIIGPDMGWKPLKNRAKTATVNVHLDDYDHVAFDLDGTLVDSEAVVESALRRWAREERICPDNAVRMSAARRDIDLVAAIAPGLSPEREANRIADYEVQAMRLLRPIEGAVEFYSSIPAERRSIVTSSARVSALARLEAAGLSWPRIMIAAEDVSQGKPYPQPYQTLLRMLRIAGKRCLVFEDSPTGIEAAIAAGCDCVGVGPNARGHRDTRNWIENFGEASFQTG